MPGYFHQPMNRKEFLSTAAKAGSALALSSLATGNLLANDVSSLRVALLSDTHIPADPANGHRGFLPIDNLNRVVPQVVASNPAIAILDGDAARLTGEEQDYVVLKELLGPIAALAPIYIGLGNHDDRANFYKVFPHAEFTQCPIQGKHVTVVEKAGVRFVVLDSLLYVDKVAGLLGKTQRNWLADFLQRIDDKPTMLFIHHTLGDGDGDLLDVDRLFKILEPHRKVKAIFYGHSHRYEFDRHEHIHLINLPAIGYNFADTEPVGWVDAVFSTTGVDLTLRTVAGNQEGDGETTSLGW